jgi:hypothetical protein
VNADLSVAPEIAQLSIPLRPNPPAQPPAAAAPATAGRGAGHLARLAAAPQRWWDLVRFDPEAPVRIPIPDTANIWLLVLPPGATANCDCAYATLLAGEATESAHQADPARPTDGTRPLHPGRVRVHARPGSHPHRIRSAGHGYAVTLHAAATPPRSE